MCNPKESWGFSGLAKLHENAYGVPWGALGRPGMSWEYTENLAVLVSSQAYVRDCPGIDQVGWVSQGMPRASQGALWDIPIHSQIVL